MRADASGSLTPGRPNADDVELRYLAAMPNQREFEIWTLKAAHNVPSLARIWPTLGWYEREMMDLFGVQFADHPEPYPLVLRDGGLSPYQRPGFCRGRSVERQVPPADNRRNRRSATSFRANSRRCRRIRGVHVLLCRRAYHPLSAKPLLQAPRHGEAFRRMRARSGGRHRRARLRGGNGRSRARLL